MARKEARLHVSIWRDTDFTALRASTQRVYLMLLSQPTINLLGVQSLALRRWAGSAPDTTIEDIEDAIRELEEAGMVVVDWETEEVLVRSFVRYDGVWSSPKTRGAALDRRSTILSETVLRAADREIERADRERFRATGERGSDDPASSPDIRSDTPSDTPRTRAHADSSLQSPDTTPHSPDTTPHSTNTREEEGVQGEEGGVLRGEEYARGVVMQACIKTALQYLATENERALDAGRDPIHQPDRWLQATYNDLLERWGEHGLRWLQVHPNFTAEELARELQASGE